MSSNSFGDAISLAKKLLEMDCDPVDVRWQTVYDLAKRGALRGSKFGLIERYLEMDIAFHLHFSLLHYLGRMPERIDLCAVVQRSTESNTNNPRFGECDFSRVRLHNGGRNVVVFVDVREYSQEPKQIMPSIASIVRLQFLDECIGLIGNPIEQPFFREEFVLGDGGIVSGRSGTQKRELTESPQIGGKLTPMRPLDEIEEHMVEGRATVIENLPGEYRDIKRRLLNDVQCLCSIRIGHDFDRAVASVLGNASLENLLLLHSPDDFASDGLEYIAHRDNILVAAGVELPQ